MKKAFTLLLALVMCLSVLPAASRAADDVTWIGEYEYIGPFRDGLAVVSKDDRYGYVDTTGKVAVELQYYSASHFSDGMAAVFNEDYRCGFIDSTGKLVIPMQYMLEYNNDCVFSDGVAVVRKNGGAAYIDKTGKEPFRLSGKLDNAAHGLFHDGFAKVTVFSEDDYGTTPFFIDKTGKILETFDNIVGAGDFSEGLAFVRYGTGDYDADECGYIDKTGKLAIKLGRYYDYHAWDFSGGLALIFDVAEECYKFIDTAGKTAFTLKDENGEVIEYAEIYSFKEDTVVVGSGDCFYIIDRTGKVLFKSEEYCIYPSSEGLFPVSHLKTGKCGYMDKTGKLVVPADYDEATDFSGGVALVKKAGKVGILKNPLTNTGKPEEKPAAKPKDPNAYPYDSKIIIDGQELQVKMYQLRDENGNGTNYVRVRDLAALLNGSVYQFEVGYKSGKVRLFSRTAYTGNVEAAPFTGVEKYDMYTTPTVVDGVEMNLEAIQLHDKSGGGYTYYKLRELGEALGFTVSNKGRTPVITSGTIAVFTTPDGEFFSEFVDLSGYDNPDYSIKLNKGVATVKVSSAEPWTDYEEPNTKEGKKRQEVLKEIKKERKIPLENVTKVYELPRLSTPWNIPHAVLGTADGSWYYVDLVGPENGGVPTVERLSKAVGPVTSFRYCTTSHVEYIQGYESYYVGEDFLVAVMANGSEILVANIGW